MNHSLKHILSDTISAFKDTIKILQDSKLSAEEKYSKIREKNTEDGSCRYIRKKYSMDDLEVFQTHLKDCDYYPFPFFNIKPFITISSTFSPTFFSKGFITEENFIEAAISITEQRIEILKELKRQLP